MHGHQCVLERVQEVQCSRPEEVGVDVHLSVLRSYFRCGVYMLLYMDSKERPSVRALPDVVLSILSMGISADSSCVWSSLISQLPQSVLCILRSS